MTYTGARLSTSSGTIITASTPISDQSMFSVSASSGEPLTVTSNNLNLSDYWNVTSLFTQEYRLDSDDFNDTFETDREINWKQRIEGD